MFFRKKTNLDSTVGFSTFDLKRACCSCTLFVLFGGFQFDKGYIIFSKEPVMYKKGIRDFPFSINIGILNLV